MMYDWFLDSNPDVLERVSRGKEQGLQEAALKIVKNRFPTLLALAETQIVLINNPDQLAHLIDQLLVLSDEASVRQLFS